MNFFFNLIVFFSFVGFLLKNIIILLVGIYYTKYTRVYIGMNVFFLHIILLLHTNTMPRDGLYTAR